MFNPFLLTCQPYIFIQRHWYLRVVEYIYRYFFPTAIPRFPDIECPQETGDCHESALLSQPLATADTSTPSECHVAPFIRKRSRICVFFKIPRWIESIWIGEVSLVVMDGPDVALDPCSLRDEPALVGVNFC